MKKYSVYLRTLNKGFVVYEESRGHSSLEKLANHIANNRKVKINFSEKMHNSDIEYFNNRLRVKIDKIKETWQ